MHRLHLRSPLAGWALPLAEVPDPVFAQGTVGEGLAIDPVEGLLHAPCDGRVAFVAGHRHAVHLHAEGGLVLLMHVGIDTVGLRGEGFEPLVADGAVVEAGQPLLRFDLEGLARAAPSLVTPVLVSEGGRVLERVHSRLLAVGDTLMVVELDGDQSDSAVGTGEAQVRRFTLRFTHGLHARPAAQLARALAPLRAEVVLHLRGQQAALRSPVALMGLGARCGDTLEARATGEDALRALDRVAALCEAGDADDAQPGLPAEPAQAGEAREGRLPGLVASRGLALGTAAFLARQPFDLPPHSGSAAREGEALSAAIRAVRERLQAAAAAAEGAARDILQAHHALVGDPALASRAQSALSGGASAGEAWRAALSESVAALEILQDARLRERIADLRDVERQVLATLAGVEDAAASLPPEAIVLADELLPTQLLALDRSRLAGLCTVRGGPTSHVAILAAALGVPALVGLGPALLSIPAGTPLWLDAERGFVEACTEPEARARAARALHSHHDRHRHDLAAADAAARTRDGQRVVMLANLGDSEEGAAALALGAEGCGLLRTEFLFLHRDTAPDEDEQRAHYQRLQDALGARPLVIRTMDVGGDKPLAYLPGPHEDNPALGLRGIRAGLARPDLLRTQLRAVLRLADPAPVQLLLPMVNDAAEIRAVRALLRECAHALGVATLPMLGAMVETPAAALRAAQLLSEADFLSIGSNDLSQYVLAMDRGHASLGARLDGLHPAVLRLVGEVAQAGANAGKHVAVCGSLASDVQALPLLLGLGVRELSAVPRRIPELKRVLRTLDLAECRSLAQRALGLEDAAAVRRLVADPARLPEPTA